MPIDWNKISFFIFSILIRNKLQISSLFLNHSVCSSWHLCCLHNCFVLNMGHSELFRSQLWVLQCLRLRIYLAEATLFALLMRMRPTKGLTLNSTNLTSHCCCDCCVDSLVWNWERFYFGPSIRLREVSRSEINCFKFNICSILTIIQF